MTTLLLERPPALEEGFEDKTSHRRDRDLLSGRADAYGRLTLDDLITGVWEGLAVRDAVNCPVCAGPMATSPHAACGDSPTGACRNCGSRLL
jgi:hypothetical protein